VRARRRKRISPARRLLGGTGRSLIGAGLLLLLFVFYQLFGTGMAEAHSQTALRQAFSHQLGAPATTAPPSGPTSTLPGGGQAAPPTPGPPPADGAPVASMRIPKIGLDKVVVQGIGEAQLKQGPGHYSNTAMLGQPGNAAVAGHRTTYAAPFYRLNELNPGDPIYVTTPQGNFEYDVAKTTVVDPSDVAVLDPTPGNRLTLTTCHPRFSATQRMVVVADMVSHPARAPAPAPAAATAAAAAHHPARSPSLVGRRGPWVPVMAWGLGLLLVGLLVWLVARRPASQFRRAMAYAAGALPFLAVLFFFFGVLSPLLPAQY